MDPCRRAKIPYSTEVYFVAQCVTLRDEYVCVAQDMRDEVFSSRKLGVTNKYASRETCATRLIRRARFWRHFLIEFKLCMLCIFYICVLCSSFFNFV